LEIPPVCEQETRNGTKIAANHMKGTFIPAPTV
jgi:hypothetical protein